MKKTLASLFAAASLMSACKEHPKEDVPRIIKGTVIDERIIPAKNNAVYLLTLDVEEPGLATKPEEPSPTAKPEKITYFISIIPDINTPYELLAEAISHNSEVLFPYLNEKGQLNCHINRMCNLPIKDIYALRPFEDPAIIKEKLEGMLEKDREKEEEKRRAYDKRAMQEAREVYADIMRPKE